MRARTILMFYIVIFLGNNVLNNVLAVVSGRLLRLLAVSNIQLLRLKQIFIRFMSHEIRFLITVIYYRNRIFLIYLL